MSQGQFYINKAFKYSSRFDPARFINFTDTGYYDIIQSPILNEIKNLKLHGRYTINSHPYRPDVLSANIYEGDMSLWWYLLIYNGLSSTQDLVQGLEINFFYIQDLEELIFNYSNKNRKLTK